MNTTESLNKAFQILGELMNEDCFDFLEVQNLNFEDRKDYLRQMIFEYFRGGEVNLGGIIKRIDSDNFNDNERASEETIENIKNVKFDIIVIFDQIENSSTIKHIIESSKYLIINSDYKENLKLIDTRENQYVITYGFNSRATITIISNENDQIILDLQREIEALDNRKIETQEIKI